MGEVRYIDAEIEIDDDEIWHAIEDRLHEVVNTAVSEALAQMTCDKVWLTREHVRAIAVAYQNGKMDDKSRLAVVLPNMNGGFVAKAILLNEKPI
jgi:hypothetical protein